MLQRVSLKIVLQAFTYLLLIVVYLNVKIDINSYTYTIDIAIFRLTRCRQKQQSALKLEDTGWCYNSQPC